MILLPKQYYIFVSYEFLCKIYAAKIAVLARSRDSVSKGCLCTKQLYGQLVQVMIRRLYKLLLDVTQQSHTHALSMRAFCFVLFLFLFCFLMYNVARFLRLHSYMLCCSQLSIVDMLRPYHASFRAALSYVHVIAHFVSS